MPVARIVRPWGRDGAVLAEVDVEDVSELTGGREVFLDAGSCFDRIHVMEARWHGKGRAVLKIEGTNSVEDAELLRGTRLFANSSESPAPPQGAFRAFQLLGLRVVTVRGEDVGCVSEIRQTGGADLLVVRGGGRERLIPFARTICTRVDPEAGVIEIDPPEGLLEL